jgi:transposase
LRENCIAIIVQIYQGTTVMAVNGCPVCLHKQRIIDEQQEEIKNLKAKLRYQDRQGQEGFFGSSTPSSKIPVKPNSEKKDKKPRGARQGHKGAGRKSHDDETADRMTDIGPESETCPDCGGLLEKKGWTERSVIDTPRQKTEKTKFRLAKRYCSHCRRTFTPQAPGVLPKSLYGNQLIADAVEMHYLHGVPIGRISEHFGIGAGSLVKMFRRCADLFETLPDRLIEEYRKAPVKHADETGWRTGGKNGYVWLFATPDLSIFQFGKSRSSKVPQAVFGKDPLSGVLVVDRYAAYNKLLCQIQYCYSHLLREVEDLEKEFPGEPEISAFVAVVAPQLSLAMGLRGQPISDTEFYRRAAALREEIKATMAQPAKHLGIRHIQDIFRQYEHRLFLWADDRAVPADNNLAERDLRPSVIARKVSFGSITDAGAKTRSTLTTVAATVKKRGGTAGGRIKEALDLLARNPKADPFEVLFSPSNPP